MFKLVRKYISIDKTERSILNQSFVWLIIAFVFVRLVPLKWFNSILGENNKETKTNLNDNQYNIVVVFKMNLERLKKYFPWKIKCFEEAIAGKKVLEKYNIKTTLYLGLVKETKTNLKAHAWLKCGKLFVTGKKGYKKFTVVTYYS